MKGFARMTKLSNIGGRADYISNPKRQEEILAKSESVDWKPYQEYEQSHQMSAQRNNEGRELIIALPNEWAKIPPEQLQAKAQKVAETAIGKSTDMQWAVHWNKAHTNLHLHVVFSERQKEKEPKRWDRNVYSTEDGKVARKKSERAINPDGTYKLLHAKGELKDGFTAKNPDYNKKSWLYNQKIEIKITLRKLGAIIRHDEVLPEFHHGRGSDSESIKLKNEVIRENNNRLGQIAGTIGMTFTDSVRELRYWIHEKEVPVLYHDGEKVRVEHFKDPEEAKKFMERTSMNPEKEKANDVSMQMDQQQKTSSVLDKSAPEEAPKSNSSLVAAMMEVEDSKQAVKQAKSRIFENREVNHEVINRPAELRSLVPKLEEAHRTYHAIDEKLRTEYPRPVEPKKSIFTSRKKKEQYQQDIKVWESKTEDLRTAGKQALADIDRYYGEVKKYLEPHELKVGYNGYGGYSAGVPDINPYRMTDQDLKQISQAMERRIDNIYQPRANIEQAYADKLTGLERAEKALTASQTRLGELSKGLSQITMEEAKRAVSELRKGQEKTVEHKTHSKSIGHER